MNRLVFRCQQQLRGSNTRCSGSERIFISSYCRYHTQGRNHDGHGMCWMYVDCLWNTILHVCVHDCSSSIPHHYRYDEVIYSYEPSFCSLTNTDLQCILLADLVAGLITPLVRCGSTADPTRVCRSICRVIPRDVSIFLLPNDQVSTARWTDDRSTVFSCSRRRKAEFALQKVQMQELTAKGMVFDRLAVAYGRITCVSIPTHLLCS